MISEQIKELTNRVPVTLFLAFYLLYLGFDYYRFTTEPDSPLLMKTREADSIKESKKKLESKLKETKIFAQTLETQKVELRALAQQLQGMKESLPERQDVPAFMKMIFTEAQKVGLKIVSLKPLGSKDQQAYAEESYSLVFRGVYVQLISFLQRISNLSDIVHVEQMDVRSIGSKRSKFIELEGTLELKTFRYLASKEEVKEREKK